MSFVVPGRRMGNRPSFAGSLTSQMSQRSDDSLISPPTTSPEDPSATSGVAGRMIAELIRESGTTRRVLERVPGDRLAWKPHPRSMSLGQLALHLAQLPSAVATLVERLTVEAPTVGLAEPASHRDILDALELSVADAVARLTSWGDADMEATWTLTRGGAELIARPRGEVLRSIMLNHTYHHRGQLTVYLRLLDVPLPPVYGPTADENPFS